MIRKFFCFTLFIWFTFPLYISAQTLQGDSWETVRQQGEGEIIFTYFVMEGFSYTNENGERTGVAIDIFRQFVNFVENSYDVELNVKYEAESDFVTFYNSVKNGRNGVFGMGNVTITEERKKEVTFSPPYFRNIAVLITHENAPDLNSLDELATIYGDKTALVYEGTTHEERFARLKNRNYPGMKTEPVQSNEEAVERVSSSEEFYSYVDLPIFWRAQKNGRSLKRLPVGDQATESFGIIMPLNTDWKEPVEAFFNIGGGYRSNPTYRDILVKHLGVEVTKMLQLTMSN